MSAAVAIQGELISDDPRDPAAVSSGVLADLREVIRCQRELGGLLTTGQAAAVLGVTPSSVRSWAFRGRLRSVRVLGVVMVSAPEVLALHRQRLTDGLAVGGRGHKAPSLCVLTEEAWRDIDPLGE